MRHTLGGSIMGTVLEARHIYKSFVGVQALKDINIKIESGKIHCLAGENGCGKSTFVKNISGVYTPDSGEVVLNGSLYHCLTPAQAMKEGIQVIYQDLSLFQHLTVAENIAISRLKSDRKRIVNWKKVREIAGEQLDKIGVRMDIDQPVGEISMANRQITAICRALAQDARILFMDEPTTALTKTEVDRLMKIMLDLKKKGLAVIFISHKLDEVFSVADTITIFRNGEKIGDFESKELDKKSLSYHMTGREVEYPRYRRSVKDDTPVLEIEDLTRKGQYESLSLTVRSGDIVGVTGLLGSGRTELALSLFGLNPADSGRIKIDGKEAAISSPMAAKKLGIALLPEDRFRQGLFMDREVKENISSAIVDDISGKGLLDKDREKKVAEDYTRQLKVRTPSVETAVGTLSGGNQQKIVIGKWTAAKPRVFIMDTPTVGIDIGSKAEIYEQIHKLAADGMSIIFISDEIQEIIANCNRVMVLADGRCVRMLEEEDLKENAEQTITELIGRHAEETAKGERYEDKEIRPVSGDSPADNYFVQCFCRGQESGVHTYRNYF